MKAGDLFRRQYGYDFVDISAALKLPERVNDNRNAVEFDKLLGPSAAQPSSLPGGDDDGDIHSVMTQCPICGLRQAPVGLRVTTGGIVHHFLRPHFLRKAVRKSSCRQ